MKYKDILAEYHQKCIDYAKSNEGRIFRMNSMNYSVFDPFGGGDGLATRSTTIFGGYGRIVGWQKLNNDPLVRIVRVDFGNSYSYCPGGRIDSRDFVTVQIKTWTGYSLLGTILNTDFEDFIEDESKLPKFVYDSFYKDMVEMDQPWRLSIEKFDKNERPWSDGRHPELYNRKIEEREAYMQQFIRNSLHQL